MACLKYRFPLKIRVRNGVQDKLKPHRLWLGLSARLLLLTIVFVMIAEVLIYVPSIAYFRKTWLEERLAAAQIAALALMASSDQMVSQGLTRELLANAEVQAVVLKRGDNRRLILREDMPLDIQAHYDLRNASYGGLMMDAYETMRGQGDRLIGVTGDAKQNAGLYIQIILREEPLRQAMYAHTGNLLLLSFVISIITGVLVYLSLQWLMVRPIRKMTRDLIAFRESPEDLSAAFTPSTRNDEIGIGQRELHQMQETVRSALHQKTRLADLGAGVAKINHDLRNILASAHLISDRLAVSQDPAVKSLAPRLIKAIDRAIDLCEKTLHYGKPDEITARPQSFDLRRTLDEVAAALGLDMTTPRNSVTWSNNVAGHIKVHANPDHVFRALLNICRNAFQVLEASPPPSGRREISADAWVEAGRIIIDITDSGPGLPAAARDHLFEPFRGGVRSGGSGLGLAIARELTLASGGSITLLKSDLSGTVFRLTLPASGGRKETRKKSHKESIPA